MFAVVLACCGCCLTLCRSGCCLTLCRLPLLRQVTQARTATPSHTKIALFHYLTKSEQEYMQKMRRGSAAGNYKSPEFFYTINQYATDTCTPAIPLGLKCCPTVLAELGAAGVKQAQQRLAALQAKGSGGGGVAGATGKQAHRHS